MTPQNYIENELQKLKTPLRVQKPMGIESTVDEIYRLLMSKKFRKYSSPDELKAHIRQAIKINVQQNQPINITFLHGAYKLWRLEECPEADWAEFFALLYYSNWVKAICEIYEPGVWFDFFVDDLVVPIFDNTSLEDTRTYISSYQSVMDFLKQFQPVNLNMTITPVGSLFASVEAFQKSLESNVELKRREFNGLPTINEKQSAMIELNTKVTEEQEADPDWKEKVALIESAYSLTKAEPGYHKNRPEKILAFVQPIGSSAIGVGTTKDSIAKFWVGVGGLRPRDGSYRQIILTPKQLSAAHFRWENVDIDITGKNFSKIRILEAVV